MLKLTELLTIGAVMIFATIPWHEFSFMIPPALVLCVAIGAGLAVVCIPADRRSVGVSITTALAGMGCGLLFTEWALEIFSVQSAAAAKAVAGLLGMGGLPICGLAMRSIDWATNNPQTWLGRIFANLIPPKNETSKNDSLV